ncbi:hypothetical protein YC2023_105962 [Brassica napus]
MKVFCGEDSRSQRRICNHRMITQCGLVSKKVNEKLSIPELDECTNLTNFDSPPYYISIFNFFSRKLYDVVNIILQNFSKEEDEEAHLLITRVRRDLLQL